MKEETTLPYRPQLTRESRLEGCTYLVQGVQQEAELEVEVLEQHRQNTPYHQTWEECLVQ